MTPDLITIPTIEDLTRRTFITGALASALLIACSDDEEPSATPTSLTRTIDDLFGAVVIPTAPEQVIAGDWFTMGNMLTLGIKPVAAAVNHSSVPTYFAAGIADIADISTDDGPDIEKALSLNPDLIILDAGPSNAGDELYPKWKMAAATFGYSGGYAYIEDIERNLTEVARALNREEQAAEILDQYHRRVRDLAGRVEKAGLSTKPVTVLRVLNGANHSIRVGTSESIAFRALGIAQPADQQNPEALQIPVSVENLNLLNPADTLFVWANDNARDAMDSLLQSPVWQTLDAARNNRVHVVDASIWNSKDLTGLELILDDIERFFIAPAERA